MVKLILKKQNKIAMTVVTVKPARVSLFDEFVNSGIPAFRSQSPAYPATNVWENGDQFRLELAAPGLEKKDFAINVEKEVLTISANQEAAAIEGETVRRREFGTTNFKRSWRLPASIDTTAIVARYEAGILFVVLPKKEEAKEKPARTIEIG